MLIEIGIAVEIDIGSIGANLDNDPDPDFDFDFERLDLLHCENLAHLHRFCPVKDF